MVQHPRHKTKQDGGVSTHTDINAGFVVVMDSGHDPPFDMEEIGEQVAAFGGSADEFWHDLATSAVQQYRAFNVEYLCQYNDPDFLSIEEQGLVIQNGLALSPIAWAHTRYTADWVIEWALIGGWASRELFTPPSNPSTDMMVNSLIHSKIDDQDWLAGPVLLLNKAPFRH